MGYRFAGPSSRRVGPGRAGLIAVLLGASLAAGCATPPPADDPEAVEAFRETNDPLEPLNRATFEFNGIFDSLITRPLSYLYKEGVPGQLQVSVHSFLENLQGPVALLNDLLQADFDRAGDTLSRFAMNSTLGLLGINDVASDVGIPPYEQDFGQTLAIWGVDTGPYLVLPVIGPSSVRHGTGRVVDIFIDPVGWLTSRDFRIAVAATRVVDFRARNYDDVNRLMEKSLDPYAASRSLYRQYRARLVSRRGPPQ